MRQSYGGDRRVVAQRVGQRHQFIATGPAVLDVDRVAGVRALCDRGGDGGEIDRHLGDLTVERFQLVGRQTVVGGVKERVPVARGGGGGGGGGGGRTSMVGGTSFWIVWIVWPFVFVFGFVVGGRDIVGVVGVVVPFVEPQLTQRRFSRRVHVFLGGRTWAYLQLLHYVFLR